MILFNIYHHNSTKRWKIDSIIRMGRASMQALRMKKMNPYLAGKPVTAQRAFLGSGKREKKKTKKQNKTKI